MYVSRPKVPQVLLLAEPEMGPEDVNRAPHRIVSNSQHASTRTARAKCGAAEGVVVIWIALKKKNIFGPRGLPRFENLGRILGQESFGKSYGANFADSLFLPTFITWVPF